MAVEVHQTAIVSPGAELGDGVKIGPYAVIGPQVKIGARTVVGPHVVIQNRTTLGADNKIYQFASLGSEPQDLKFKGEPSELIIGDNNVIRESATLNIGTELGEMRTVVGDHNLFMAYSHVAHDCFVGNRSVFANSCALAGHVRIGTGVIVGGLVGIHQFVRIGDFAFLGGGAKVALDVPPYCIGQGDRCSLRGLNLVGLKRNGFSVEDITSVKRLYRKLFLAPGSIADKVNDLPSELRMNPRVGLFIEFLQGSRRGISHAKRGSSEEGSGE